MHKISNKKKNAVCTWLDHRPTFCVIRIEKKIGGVPLCEPRKTQTHFPTLFGIPFFCTFGNIQNVKMTKAKRRDGNIVIIIGKSSKQLSHQDCTCMLEKHLLKPLSWHNTCDTWPSYNTKLMRNSRLIFYLLRNVPCTTKEILQAAVLCYAMVRKFRLKKSLKNRNQTWSNLTFMRKKPSWEV